MSNRRSQRWFRTIRSVKFAAGNTANRVVKLKRVTYEEGNFSRKSGEAAIRGKRNVDNISNLFMRTAVCTLKESVITKIIDYTKIHKHINITGQA